jgi:uncharacterized protein YbaP (TraB family)
MKAFKVTLSKFLVLLSMFYTGSQLTAQTDGILWKVSGNGLSKPSYIFGTIHLYCNPENLLTQPLVDAAKASDVVAMELNLNDYNTLVAIYTSSMAPVKKPLSEMLTKAQYKTVDSAIRVVLKDSISTYNAKSPIAMMGYLYGSNDVMGCAQPMPVDFSIAQLAKQLGKETYGLESFEFQDSVLKAIPDSIQVKWLMDFCGNMGKSKKEFGDFISSYDAQLSNKLYELSVTVSPEFELYKELLLTDRNNSWVNFLKENMTSYAIFTAVGAGHLGGDDGLIAQLKKAGYTLTPISIK